MSKEPTNQANPAIPEFTLKLTPEDPTAIGTLKNHARLQSDPAQAAKIMDVVKQFQDYLAEKSEDKNK